MLLLAAMATTALACEAGGLPAAFGRSPSSAVAFAEGAPVQRFEAGRSDTTLYVPASLAVRDGRFDLVVHFHGPHEGAALAVKESDLRAAIVNVDLGSGSRIYEVFASAGSLDRLIAFAETELDQLGRVPAGRAGRVALSAWSAGYGAVRELLKDPAVFRRVDAVLLADGFFSEWDDPSKGAVALEKLEDSITFARRAKEGHKLFVLTHSAIDRRAYAGAPDCAAVLARLLDVERRPAAEGAPEAGGAATYVVDRGELHLWGFAGKTWADHVAQHRAMGKLQFAALKRFWERP